VGSHRRTGTEGALGQAKRDRDQFAIGICSQGRSPVYHPDKAGRFWHLLGSEVFNRMAPWIQLHVAAQVPGMGFAQSGVQCFPGQAVSPVVSLGWRTQAEGRCRCGLEVGLTPSLYASRIPRLVGSIASSFFSPRAPSPGCAGTVGLHLPHQTSPPGDLNRGDARIHCQKRSWRGLSLAKNKVVRSSVDVGGDAVRVAVISPLHPGRKVDFHRLPWE